MRKDVCGDWFAQLSQKFGKQNGPWEEKTNSRWQHTHLIKNVSKWKRSELLTSLPNIHGLKKKVISEIERLEVSIFGVRQRKVREQRLEYQYYLVNRYI